MTHRYEDRSRLTSANAEMCAVMFWFGGAFLLGCAAPGHPPKSIVGTNIERLNGSVEFGAINPLPFSLSRTLFAPNRGSFRCLTISLQ